MKTINLNKTWDSLTAEIHRIKPSRNSFLKREVLFELQILLSRYELAKSEKNKKMMKFYTDVLGAYEKHRIV